jgi:hypothetical protein
MDAGTQRSAVWRAKAGHYAALRDAGRLYGLTAWRLLAVVPSARRAVSVAAAIASGGAGAFSFVATAANLDGGQAFAPVLWSCLELARIPSAQPAAGLLDGLASPINETTQPHQSAVDRVCPSETGVVSP